MIAYHAREFWACATYGLTSTTDNVTYTNLVNIKRIAHPLAGAGV